MDRRKKLFNYSESLTDKILQESVESHNARVFPKVRVADALNIECSGITNELYSYALKAHFDFVVCRGSLPLFAVEFDGPHHQTELNTIRRDALKASVCANLGMPLLRIDSVHLRKVGQITVLAWLIHVWFMKEAWDEDPPSDPDEPFDYYGWFTIPPKTQKFVDDLVTDGFAIVDGVHVDGTVSLEHPLIRQLFKPTPDLDLDPFLPTRHFMQRFADKTTFGHKTVMNVEGAYCSAYTFLQVSEIETIVGQARCQVNWDWPVICYDVANEISNFDAAQKLRRHLAGEVQAMRLAEVKELRNRLKMRGYQ